MDIFSKKESQNFFFAKNWGADVRAHVCTLKLIYARTRTHISEHFRAPICTKIAAPARVRVRAHTRTLKVCCIAIHTIAKLEFGSSVGSHFLANELTLFKLRITCSNMLHANKSVQKKYFPLMYKFPIYIFLHCSVLECVLSGRF